MFLIDGNELIKKPFAITIEHHQFDLINFYKNPSETELPYCILNRGEVRVII